MIIVAVQCCFSLLTACKTQDAVADILQVRLELESCNETDNLALS